MNILLDTNILIPMEDTARLLDPSLAKMRRLSEVNGHVLCVHPSQKDDIRRDKHERRKLIVLSRISQYQTIQSPPELSSIELLQYGWQQEKDNDRIDNLLLHALCRGAVHFLVTNDKGIHKKARQAKVQEQVHYLDQFLAFLDAQVGEDVSPPFGIQERYLYEFNVHQTFFDSLRVGYDGFNNWYLRSAQAQRKAWCISNNESVRAMCIYKHENTPAIVDGGANLDGNALKLCTFKIGNEVRGRKLGERILYTAFKHAVMHRLPYVYLHTFGEEQEMLVSLCEDYGFKNVGKYNNRDQVYLKEMFVPGRLIADTTPLDFGINFYPHFLDGTNVEKYIVPIRPEYHNDLFADISDTAKGLFANDSSMYGPQANTIKKAYLCHSKIGNIKPGSLLLFYRTKDRQSIECIGLVEQLYRGRELGRILPLISKRTVFSKVEIETMAKKDTLVILFRLMEVFDPITFYDIQKAGVKHPIQTIRKITHEQYQKFFSQDMRA